LPALKPLRWVGSSKRDLVAFPRAVRRQIGYALYFAQTRDKYPAAKPLKGFHGAGVLEVVEYYQGNTYRAVYTVKFSEIVYVLHAFQKKSKKGIATPQFEIDLIRDRLKLAESDYQRGRRS
jgi:phage-related protein